jgi:hypothetical protein
MRANDIELGKEDYSAFQKTIKVDGDLSDWGDKSVFTTAKFYIPKGSGPQGTLVSFEEYNGGTWTGPEDYTAAFAITWDVDNLYIGMLVTDDYHEDMANSAWNGDSLQVVFANASRDIYTQYYNYALGGEEGALGDLVKEDQRGPGGAEFAVVRNAAKKETYYEIRFPASSLEAAKFEAGMQIGLGLCANDGDEDTPGQKGWSGWGPHAIVFGTSASETGLVTLQTGAFPGSGPFPDAAPPRFTKIAVSGANVVIEWTGGGMLIASDVVTGQYTPVMDNPASPATIPLSGTARFFRIRQ